MLFPIIAIAAAVKGYWGFTALGVAAAVFSLLVLLAGRRYGKGTLRNVGRLLAGR